MPKRKDVTPVVFIQSMEDDARWDNTRYGHINCSILIIDHQDERAHPTNPSNYCGSRFKDVVITSQMDSQTATGYRDNGDGTKSPTDRTYGWEIGVKSFTTLPYRHVEAVIKTLRRMYKATNPVRFVHYADFVVAAGKAIGAKFVMTHRQNGSSYENWDWEYMDAEEARAYINRLEQQLALKLTGRS